MPSPPNISFKSEGGVDVSLKGEGSYSKPTDTPEQSQSIRVPEHGRGVIESTVLVTEIRTDSSEWS